MWLQSDQILIRDEFVTVFLKYHAGKGPAADDKYLLVVLFELLHQRDKIAVAPHNDEGVDVIPCKRHLQSIEGEVDVRTILVAARRQISLDHLYRVLGQHAAVIVGSLPVSVGDLCDDLAALLDRFKDSVNIKPSGQSGSYAYLDVVKVDENRNFESLFAQDFRLYVGCIRVF